MFDQVFLVGLCLQGGAQGSRVHVGEVQYPGKVGNAPVQIFCLFIVITFI